ncbi:MAG: sulfatase-like hydrolase/transferase [Porphyromonadaceae bacterium]|nr:sulfatase-like hydrolase/transferase [Porphyromonadaceae bacterium]
MLFTNRMKKMFSSWLKKYSSGLSEGLWILAVLFLLQMSINIAFIYKSYGLLPEGETLIVGISLWGTIIRSTLRSIFWAAIAWWGYALLAKYRTAKIIWGSTIMVLSLLMFAIEGFILHRYGMVYTQSVIQILAGTNPREASEYFEASFDVSIFIAVLFICFVIAWAVVKYVSWAKDKHFRFVPILFLLSIPPVSIVLGYSIPRTYQKVMDSGQAYDLTIAPYDRLLWNTMGFIRESQAISDATNRIARIDIGNLEEMSYVTAPPQSQLHIILVVGETLRRDYMHCYGFPLSNTPGLDSLLATGDLTAYTDAVSPAPNTIESLTKVFTYQTNEMQGKWYDYPALPSIFSKAGYWVEWTSNQESTGTFIQPLNTFAQLSDGHKYVNARSIDEEHDITKNFYDEDLLPYLKDTSKAKEGGKSGLVQIVHLMGSHPVYAKRFPETFAKFSPDSLPVKRGADKDAVVSDYINSVYYNDYVVTQIVNFYSNKPALVVYFSDHGEVIYDDPKNPNYSDHGMLPQGVAVPLFVYLSPEVRRGYPDLYNRIRQCKDRRIMLDLFTHSITGLLGIKNKYSDPKLDFFSDEYNEQRPRIIRSFSQELVL